jgi:hypothetical protein
VVSSHYTAQDISNAKDMLWKNGNTEIIGKKINRQDSAQRSESEANTLDIFNAISKLDKAQSVPLFVVDYKHLNLLIKSIPEEFNSMNVCDRLGRLEKSVNAMQESMDRVIAENMSLKDKSVNAIQESMDRVIAENMSLNENCAQKLDTVRKSSYAKVIIQEPKKNHPLASSGAIPKIKYGTTPESAPMQNSEEFQQPKYFVRKQKRQAVVGMRKGSCADIRGAPEPHRDVFVFRTDKSTTEIGIKNHVTSQGLTVHDVKCMSHPDAMHNSFKVTVPSSQLHQILDPEIWPVGVCIRRFIHPKTKHKEENRNTIHNSTV